MEDTLLRWYSDEELSIYFNHTPNTNMVRVVPSMTYYEKRDASRYPFINCTSLKVTVILATGQTYMFCIPKGFRWDGATIPPISRLLIGAKTENLFRVPSLVHDYVCNNKYVIRFDRKLSSKILRGLLLANGVAHWRVNLMYFFVELYQRLTQREWTK